MNQSREASWRGSAALPSLSGTLTAGASSPAPERTTALPGWSISPRLLRTPTRHLRHSSLTSPKRTSSPTSKSRTDVIWLLPEGIDCFAGDLSEQEKKLVWATQCVPAPDLFNAKVGGIAWRSKPSWYIVAKNDRTVHPDMERFVAKRMGATTTEVASSHVPMLSNPSLVIDVIRAAANAIQARSARA